MQIFNTLFLKILEMSLTAGIVIMMVLFVRCLIRGLPKSYAYMLWLVVAFRLVVPFSANSDISIFNVLMQENVKNEAGVGNEDVAGTFDSQAGQEEYVQNHIADSEKDSPDTLNAKKAAELNQISNIKYPDIFANHISVFGSSGEDCPGGTKAHNACIFTFIWIAGMMLLGFHTVISYMRMHRKLRYRVWLGDNVYECDQIRSPFVFGIIRPKICLPFRMHETEQQCILAHERYHIKRKDYLIKPFAYVLVMVYWFQPLVWIAYHFMCIDMEMSCDEKVISKFTIEMRKEYSRLLLAFAANRRQHPVSPLAFGENNAMKRIRNILQYKKAARWKLAAGAATVMLTMAACATNASTDGAIAPASDKTVPVQNDLIDTANQSESSAMVHNDANTDTDITAVNGTGVTTQNTEQHPNESDQGTQHPILEHHKAQWAENSMCDMELCSLDYADSDSIVFHISSGLFQYDLQEQRIIRSIDLKALNCQEVQTGGKCRVTVYQNSDDELQAVIAPYPYSDEDSYIYDLERDKLFAYDEELLARYTLFDGLVSKYDLPEEDQLKGWRHAEYILPLGEHSYGVLQWDSIDLITMYYEAVGQRWDIFPKEQATMPRLIKQDDSFYQSIAMYAGQNIDQCVMDYEGLYNMHDYAGVCALSTGLEYSDEMQRDFGARSDRLSAIKQVSHSEDEKEYLYQFLCGEDYGTGAIVYVNFSYIDGVGWRAESFPDTSGNE